MRILHVFEPADGGVPVIVRDLSRELVGRGHEVQAVVSERCVLVEGLQEAGVGVLNVPMVPEMVAPADDLRALRRLASILRRRRWDVVHTHGNKAGVLARPLASALGLPVVHSTQGYAYVTQQWRPRRGMALRRALTFHLERLLADRADVIVCSSEADRQESIRDGVACPERFAMVHNGIADPKPAQPDRTLLDFRGERPLVGFLARLHEQKAPLVLVEALAALKARGIPVRAAFVGNGPQEGDVRAALSAAGLDGDVLVLPFEGGPESYLAAFDLFVLPSVWESLPLGAMEAMAAGLPVIATSVAGVPEVVADGETGLLVPPGDSGALADAIAQLLDDPALRERMGAAGRVRQAECFTMAAMAEASERVYELARERRYSRATS